MFWRNGHDQVERQFLRFVRWKWLPKELIMSHSEGGLGEPSVAAPPQTLNLGVHMALIMPARRPTTTRMQTRIKVLNVEHRRKPQRCCAVGTKH